MKNNIFRFLLILFVSILMSFAFQSPMAYSDDVLSPDSSVTHIVKSGESIASISFDYYTDEERDRGAHWIHIYAYSVEQGLIDADDQPINTIKKTSYVNLYTGQRLFIPYFDDAYPKKDKLLYQYTFGLDLPIDEIDTQTTDEPQQPVDIDTTEDSMTDTDEPLDTIDYDDDDDGKPTEPEIKPAELSIVKGTDKEIEIEVDPHREPLVIDESIKLIGQIKDQDLKKECFKLISNDIEKLKLNKDSLLYLSESIKSITDSNYKTDVLCKLALKMKEYDTEIAIELYNKALVFAKSLDTYVDDEYNTMFNLISVLFSLGFDEEKELFIKLLDVMHILYSGYEKLDIVNKLLQNIPEDKLNNFVEEIIIFINSIEDNSTKCQALSDMAFHLSNIDKNKAVMIFDKAIEEAEKIEDYGYKVDSLNYIAFHLSNIDKNKAVMIFDKAIEEAEKIEDHGYKAAYLFDIAKKLVGFDKNKAVMIFDKAIEEAEKINDLWKKLDVFSNFINPSLESFIFGEKRFTESIITQLNYIDKFQSDSKSFA